MMLAALLDAEKHSRLQGFLGNLHPGIVHFPIALLATAALLEFLQMVRKKEGLAPGTFPLLVIAALSAVPACLFGWLLADYEGTEGTTVDLHKWLGIASAGVAVALAAAAARCRSSAVLLKAFRGALFLGAGLVLATGYLGGEMVMGTDHLLKFLRPEEPAKTGSGKEEPATGDASKTVSAASGKVDFKTQILPIIKNSCLKCHNPGKKKGKLLLDTRENAMKGGENGECIVPGQPEKSSFYTLTVEKDPDARMPEKDPALPKEQTELIRRWIQEGAVWPAGVVIK
jgi:uncharacterized membrane protein